KKHVLNYHRASKCGYIALGEVLIHQSIEHQKAFFSGLLMCGSVWACPNCAAKVQERRRIEIATAMDYMYQNGKKAVMVTLTFPHTKKDDLKGLLEAQKEAFKHLRAGKAWQGFKGRTGYDGLIRSLELTYGDNGWHPHTHELWFVDKDADADAMKAFVLNRWENVCIKAGLLDGTKPNKIKAFRRHSVDVKDNCSTSDYLAKQDDSRNWGADREIAKATSKAGKAKGMHPFGFLTKFAETKDSIWAKRWIDYNKAIKGRAQLFWSRGLKDLVGVNDASDEELAALTEDEAKEIMSVTPPEWRKIAKSGTQALVLDTAEETSNPDVIRAVINNSSGSDEDIVDLIQKRVNRQKQVLGESILANQNDDIDVSKVDFIRATDEFLADFKESLKPDEPKKEYVPKKSMQEIYGGGKNKQRTHDNNGQIIFKW
ncbi:protein rep, partial [Vibrio parahaemolyticus]